AFGPTGEENYSKKLSLRAKRLAIRQGLSLAAHENRIKVVEKIASTDGKVKPIINLLSKIGAEGRVLVVVPEKDNLTDRSTRNLAKVKTVQSTYLNIYDILNADQIIISKEALEAIDGWLGGKHA